MVGAEVREPVRVLVADDHPVVRAGLVALIDDQPDLVVVAQAGDGNEAVRLSGEMPVDVVLLDLRMPQLDGVNACRQILEAADDEQPTGPIPQVLILTTYETDDDILAAIEAGAVGYLLKAAPGEEILTGIRMAARGQSALAPSVAAALVRRTRSPAVTITGATSGPELTAREGQVLELVARGLVNKEIGRHLGISETTVKTHVANTLSKLDASTRAHAVHRAQELGLLTIHTEN